MKIVLKIQNVEYNSRRTAYRSRGFDFYPYETYLIFKKNCYLIGFTVLTESIYTVK
jgi:hypothetical protein